MLRNLYSFSVSLATTRWALLALAGISFLESSFFPIPPDILLIPLIIAVPTRAFLIAFVCTISSVAGGAFGYYIGAELFNTIGDPILKFYSNVNEFEEFRTRFNEQGHWAVLFAGITPFPYKVITITSGVTELPFWNFMFWSTIARGFRFFVVAALLWYFGEPIRHFIEKRLGLMFTALLLMLVAGFAAIKLF